MTSYYLAARYSRHDEMQGVRDVLEGLGHSVTSRWIDCHTDIEGDHTSSFSVETLNDPTKLGDCRYVAIHDLIDIDRADVLLSFSGGGRKGGRHVEVGYALGRGKPVIVIGDRENVFHTLAAVTHYRSWPHFVMSLPKPWNEAVS